MTRGAFRSVAGPKKQHLAEERVRESEREYIGESSTQSRIRRKRRRKNWTNSRNKAESEEAVAETDRGHLENTHLDWGADRPVDTT